MARETMRSRPSEFRDMIRDAWERMNDKEKDVVRESMGDQENGLDVQAVRETMRARPSEFRRKIHDAWENLHEKASTAARETMRSRPSEFRGIIHDASVPSSMDEFNQQVYIAKQACEDLLNKTTKVNDAANNPNTATSVYTEPQQGEVAQVLVTPNTSSACNQRLQEDLAAVMRQNQKLTATLNEFAQTSAQCRMEVAEMKREICGQKNAKNIYLEPREERNGVCLPSTFTDKVPTSQPSSKQNVAIFECTLPTTAGQEAHCTLQRLHSVGSDNKLTPSDQQVTWSNRRHLKEKYGKEFNEMLLGNSDPTHDGNDVILRKTVKMKNPQHPETWEREYRKKQIATEYVQPRVAVAQHIDKSFRDERVLSLQRQLAISEKRNADLADTVHEMKSDLRGLVDDHRAPESVCILSQRAERQNQQIKNRIERIQCQRQCESIQREPIQREPLSQDFTVCTLDEHVEYLKEQLRVSKQRNADLTHTVREVEGDLRKVQRSGEVKLDGRSEFVEWPELEEVGCHDITNELEIQCQPSRVMKSKRAINRIADKTNRVSRKSKRF